MIRKFCQTGEAPIFRTVARGISGDLADAARGGRDIPQSEAGMNYWASIEEMGLGSGIDPSIYGDIVIAKTITLQPISKNWYKYPEKWYQIQHWEGPVMGQDPYVGGDYTNLVPRNQIGKTETLSEGPITDYEIVYDEHRPLSSEERMDAPYWKGRPPILE